MKALDKVMSDERLNKLVDFAEIENDMDMWRYFEELSAIEYMARKAPKTRLTESSFRHRLTRDMFHIIRLNIEKNGGWCSFSECIGAIGKNKSIEYLLDYPQFVLRVFGFDTLTCMTCDAAFRATEESLMNG